MAEDKTPTSYGEILWSSSITGSSTGINYAIGMIRTKLIAVLLGPSGVGLIGLYLTVINVIGALSSFGIGSSGVREVAAAESTGDKENTSRVALTVRRTSFLVGVAGWIISILVSYPLSIWIFQSDDYIFALGALGCTLLINSVSGGQSAILQGTRRIADLARFNVLSAAGSTIVSVVVYWAMGQDGIVPALISSAFVNLFFSWRFSRRVAAGPIQQSWSDSLMGSKRLIVLGLTFMWSGLLAAFVALLTRTWIIKDLGIEANGIYQAAWGISGMFAGFILSAMGTDFFPRLTAASEDNTKINRLVNEQTEIGILLALPGLLGTLAFAPWMMEIFYSSQFVAGSNLLPVFVLGIFGRVVSWPMGYIIMAKGESRLFVITETLTNILLLILTFSLLRLFGLWGVALAFAILYGCYFGGMFGLSRYLTGFTWSFGSRRLLLFSSLLIGGGFSVQRWISGPYGILIGGLLTFAACTVSLKGIVLRLGADHPIAKALLRLPGCRFLCGVF